MGKPWRPRMPRFALPAAPRSSARKTDRAELRKAISRLGEGDVLMVTRLDRLARSTRDLLNTLDEITKRGAGFNRLPIAGPTPPRRTGA